MSCNHDIESPLIPEGKYEVVLDRFETWRFFGKQPKVALFFMVITPGEYFELEVIAYYNVLKHIGKIGTNGRFKAAKKCNLVRDFARVFPEYRFDRFDRIPLSKLTKVAVLAEITTVKRGWDQCEIPESVQYSKVNRLLTRITS